LFATPVKVVISGKTKPCRSRGIIKPEEPQEKKI